MLQNVGVLYNLTYKCASRHSGVQFFDIWPSKSGPNMWCFAHFDLQMCFAPQRRAIFADQKWQNRSRHEVFCAFWLAKALRATAACHFCGSEVAKSVLPWRLLRILTCKGASRHSGVPFLRIRSGKIGPAMRSFAHFDLNALRATAACHFSSVCWTATSAPAALASLLFEHQEPRIIEKTQRFETSLTFGARVASF